MIIITGDSGSGKTSCLTEISGKYSYYNAATKLYTQENDTLVIDEAHLLGVLEFYKLAKKHKHFVLLADEYLIPKHDEKDGKLAPLFHFLQHREKTVFLCKRPDCALTRNIISKTWLEMDETFHILKGVNVEKELAQVDKDSVVVYDRKTIQEAKARYHVPRIMFVYYEEVISAQFMYYAASRATEKFLLITPKQLLFIINN